MTGNAALFLFIAAATVALFTFLSVAHWATTSAEERKARERYALLRKIAEQPVETAGLVLELLREDEAKKEQKQRKKEHQMRKNGLQSGLIWLAVGVGVSIMLAAIAPTSGVWTVGVIPMLIGVVVFGFAFFSKPADPLRHDSNRTDR